ncbi:MAG: carboxypeptidase regulatory-like domain-containing protein [Opitutaceae bacterium]|nr:carboxypeptidase regulatory-like domain-containing protein [Opitutaceae bacterium]
MHPSRPPLGPRLLSSPLAALIACLGCLAPLPSISSAATPASAAQAGTIFGRVQRAENGEYLTNARVAVKGTGLVVFTDASGSFRLSAVPVGAVVLQVFYTGLPLTEVPLQVDAAAPLQRDIVLTAVARGPRANETQVVKLDEFQVSASREMSAAALAINEQRFAPNLKNVVATDEFGDVGEGNVSEFIKFLPGVSMDSLGGILMGASINGVPSDYVPVTVGGFDFANTPLIGGTGRSVDLSMLSVNNVSRIEVSLSPTPESSGSALAGSINAIPRSAFERSRPELKASVFLMMRDNQRDFHKTPGPRVATRKVHPGFDFSYTNPVSKNFGFTVSAGTTHQFSGEPASTNTWRGAGTATNGAAFPHTTVDKPYLSAYATRNSAKEELRRSLGTTIDYRLTPFDRLSFGLQAYTFSTFINHSQVAFNVGRVLPGNFSPTFTRGDTGAGDLTLTSNGNVRRNWSYTPTLVWRHDGPLWKAEAGAALSRARNRTTNLQEGFMQLTTSRRTGVTVSFADNFYLRPGSIIVTDGATGAAVNPYMLSTYALATTRGAEASTDDTKRTAYANLRRDFSWRVPVTLKGGLDVRINSRENRGLTPTYNVVGADGLTSTSPLTGDNQAAPFIDPVYSQRVASYGFPAIQTVWNEKLYQHVLANPTHYALDANAAYRSEVNASKWSEEMISAAYLRGDVSLLEGRLKLVGGLRGEQTNIEAEGPLNDPSRNVQRSASGVPILGANGRPLPITTNALAASRLTLLDRGAKVDKEYLRLFPSLNASYNLRENLIARVGFSTAVGRPNFNQYSGGITLPDTDAPASSTNRIVVNNAAIKAWSAQSMQAQLEYYFEGIGLISVGGFRREFENFFGTTVFTPTPEFLALYSLDAGTYGGYDVSTQFNVATKVRMEGYNLNYKQALTFLPHWARGVQVFANATVQRAVGDTSAEFQGYVPRGFNWGVSLTRPTYKLYANWSYRGATRGNPVNGTGIEASTFNWTSKRLYIDLSGEYVFWKRMAVFASMRNLGDASEDSKIYGPNTPEIARFRQRIQYGSLWTIGIRGTF